MLQILTEKEIKGSEQLFRRIPNVVSAYLFGSRAKGKSLASSDLDIGVVCLDKAGISPVDLSLKLQRFIVRYQIDLSVLDLSSDPLVLIQVINGPVIYQESLAARSALETRILHLYEDDRFFRKISNYYLQRSFERGVYAH